MTRAVLLLLVLLCAIAPASGAEPRATGKAKKNLKFDGKTYVYLAEGKNAAESFTEYVLEGDTGEKWTRLLSTRSYPQIDDPKALGQNLVKIFQATYPKLPSSIIEHPKSGAVVVDFVAIPPDGAFMEFNVFKYEKKPGGGVTAFQYAARKYGHTDDDLRNLGSYRKRMVAKIAAENVPKP